VREGWDGSGAGYKGMIDEGGAARGAAGGCVRQSAATQLSVWVAEEQRDVLLRLAPSFMEPARRLLQRCCNLSQNKSPVGVWCGVGKCSSVNSLCGSESKRMGE